MGGTRLVLGKRGQPTTKRGDACAADGGKLKVVANLALAFEVWGRMFSRKVRIIYTLPDKILIGRRFWREMRLILGLEKDSASITVDGTRVQGALCSRLRDTENRSLNESMGAVIEDADVDDTIKQMNFQALSPDLAKRAGLCQILWDRRDIFKGLGRIKGTVHVIALHPEAKPVCEPLRRRSPKEEEIERTVMNKLLKMVILEPSVSPWAANNVFARKTYGGTRVTSDFRRLNSLTVTDSYPMENVRDTLDWLASKSVFSVFDLKDGFYQVELHPDSRACTAIRTVLGLLHYTRLPQGLKNSPGTFQRILNLLLGDRKGKELLAFIDDTSIGAETVDEHLESLTTILDLLLSAGIKLKLSKCAFGVRTTEILGHVVDENGLRLSDRHVEAIRALTEPASGDELMSFLGLVNYFAVFVDHFAETAAPLYEALKGTVFSQKRRHCQRLMISDWEQRWERRRETRGWS